MLIVFLLFGAVLSQAQTPPFEISTPTPAGQPIPTVCVVASFGDPAKPGSPIWPSQNGTLIEGPDGSLYGTTPSGGKYGRGTVYKVTLQGEMTVIHDFDFTSGSQPKSSLTLGPDGNLYGTTFSGGEKKVGTIFKISPNGGVSVVWSFKNGWLPKLPYPQKHSDQEIKNAWPSYPTAPMVLFNGGLYGVTTYTHNQKVGMLYTTGTAADSLTSTYYFGDEKDKENPNKGVWPNALAAGKDGKLYGTTYTGRTPDTINGTIFVSGGGSIETIHKFNFDDGSGPTSLMTASDGNLYGTTVLGGAGRNRRYGVVFKLALPSRKLTVLHKFSMADGAHPYSQMVEGDDGYLYGTTRTGRGRHNEGVSGIIYRIHKDAPEFGRDAPGGEGNSGGDLISWIMDPDLITRNAFAQNVSSSAPDQSDRACKIVYKFSGPDGSGPVEGLMRHSNGKFYGTTAGGGKFSKGVVYSLDTKPPEKLGQPGKRYCCSLGQNSAQQGLGSEDLAGHKYGTQKYGDPIGYIYTGQGGLVDIGHVRDMVDMTKYIYDHLIRGEKLINMSEGGALVTKFPQNQQEALDLASAIAYVEGWAHELTTWGMGWFKDVPPGDLIPEMQGPQDFSSFSPEDLSSNIIGIEVARRAIVQGCAKDFDTAVDEAMADMMKELLAEQAVSARIKIHQVERILGQSTDGKWFEETAIFEELIRRNFTAVPWLIPADPTRYCPPWMNVNRLIQQFPNFNYMIAHPVAGQTKPVYLSNMESVTERFKKEWLKDHDKMDQWPRLPPK